jgi:hypothetical protein
MIGLFDIICGFLNRKLFKAIINFEPSISGGQFALNEGGQFDGILHQILELINKPLVLY